MSKSKALLLGEIDHAHDSWNALSDIAELVKPQATNRADFIAECKAGKLDGCVAAFRTVFSGAITGYWDEKLVSALPKSLQFVAQNSAGYDQFDVQACSARDPPIRISTTPGAVDDGTANTGMFLLLGALRGYNSAMNSLRAGNFRTIKQPLGHDPEGKVLGIIGMGGIGRNMKRKCDAFGMTTIYHNTKPLSEDAADGAEYVSLDELLATADVISLNLPLTASTHHMISTPQFAQMKKGVVIVNTSRGPVIDEDALVKALESGQVFSCGLDVFEHEPEIHPGLLANPNVILTPHMGTWTFESQKKMEELTIRNVRSALETGKLITGIAEQRNL